MALCHCLRVKDVTTLKYCILILSLTHFLKEGIKIWKLYNLDISSFNDLHCLLVDIHHMNNIKS